MKLEINPGVVFMWAVVGFAICMMILVIVSAILLIIATF